MSLQSKLHLLFLAPVTIVSAINGLVLFLAESYVYLSINILVYILVVTIILPLLGSFSDRLEKNLKDLSVDVETVKYSAGILSNESMEIRTERIEEIYSDLKHVIVSCCHNAEKAGSDSKTHLTIAKDLGRICGELGPLIISLQELKTHNENLTFFTSDCIQRKSNKMNAQILAMGSKPEKKKSKKVSKPSLRRALAFRSLAQE